MSAPETLAVIVAALDGAGIEHMVAGSFASTLHSVARTTADIDLVIDPSPGAIDLFVSALDRERHYVDPPTARRAVLDRDQFNVIDGATGWKVDLIIRRDRPFSVAEFARRIPAIIVGVPVFVATAEDTILAKLEWSVRGGSERQLRDAASILRVQRAGLDEVYIQRWAESLGLVELLEAARREAADQ